MILRQIFGEKRRQTIFKVIALPSMLLFHPSPSQLSWILLILLGHRFKSVDFPNLMTASNSADDHVTVFIFRWWYFESSEQFQEEASFAKASLCNTWAFGCKWDLRILFYVGRPQPIFLSFELWAFTSKYVQRRKIATTKIGLLKFYMEWDSDEKKL